MEGAKQGGTTETRVFAPADVAEELGISGAGLRRLALIYERVYGEFQRDPRLGRVWTPEAIERLRIARELVQDGRATSVEVALRVLDASGGVEGVPTSAGRSRGPIEALEPLIEEMRLLRGAIEGMSRRMEHLELENRELRETVNSMRELGAGETTSSDPVEERDASSTGAVVEGDPPLSEQVATSVSKIRRRMRRWWGGDG